MIFLVNDFFNWQLCPGFIEKSHRANLGTAKVDGIAGYVPMAPLLG